MKSDLTVSILATFIHEVQAGAYKPEELQSKARDVLLATGLSTLESVINYKSEDFKLKSIGRISADHEEVCFHKSAPKIVEMAHWMAWWPKLFVEVKSVPDPEL